MKQFENNSFAAALCAVLLAGLSTLPCDAQAKLDPALPEAPIVHRRTLLIFPGFQTVPDPDIPVARLWPMQKLKLAYLKTVDPSFLVETLAFAGFSQGVGYGPNYGLGPSSFGERVGYSAGNLASTNFFTTGLLPVIFHEDPRYFRKGTGSVGSRVWWALRSEAVAYNDKGRETPNISNMLGFGMSTALANAYSPESSLTLGNTSQRLGVKFGIEFVLNLTREFGAVTKPDRGQRP
ncbi:MAG: hypothetical protein ACYCSN_11215 [Acidobacteriaceae bacterium]